jgi:Tol biopolymer transport system component
MRSTRSVGILLVSALVLVFSLETLAADKLPPEKAGVIGPPQGNIAFVRSKDVWSMRADGSDQYMVCQVGNADGRLTWTPDGKRILFTRSGVLDLKGPDMLGGNHKVFDMFFASIDSAYANKKFWWYRLTDDLGSRDPEYSPDGSRVIFWKDMNANTANTTTPNYQLCTMSPDGSNLVVLRKDWRQMDKVLLMRPSLSPTGLLAFVAFFDWKPQGLVVFPEASLMVSEDSIKAQAMRNLNIVSAAWSPDGKWLAYIDNNMNKAGVYIATPDLKERYLVFAPPVATSLNNYAPSFSPDSKWLTFSTGDGSVWICDIAGNGQRRLTGPGMDASPAWSRAVKK